MSKSDTVECPRCHTELGIYVLIKGEEFLQVGGALARQLHGVCATCGKEVHWSVSDREFDKIISRVLSRD